MRADEDLRVVVVGVGQIAESIHLPVLSALSGVSIRGVVDPRPERRDLVCARWPGVEAFGSIDALAGAAAVRQRHSIATQTPLLICFMVIPPSDRNDRPTAGCVAHAGVSLFQIGWQESGPERRPKKRSNQGKLETRIG